MTEPTQEQAAEFQPAQIVDRSRYDELVAKGWNRLSKEERPEYQALKEALGIAPVKKPKTPKDFTEKKTITYVEGEVSAPTPISPSLPSREEQSDLTYEQKRDLMHQCFGLLKDADDKGRLNQVLTNEDALRGPAEDLYKTTFWLLRDGGSRGILRKLFGKQ